MTWEQKLAALQALCDTSLRMRKPGDWYVSATGRGIGGDGLSRGAYGNGKTPQEAVEDDWRQIVEHLPSDRYVIARSYSIEKRVRWNGFMWSEVASL
jgi:hypothetical protein